jgi:hypothetical protein
MKKKAAQAVADKNDDGSNVEDEGSHTKNLKNARNRKTREVVTVKRNSRRRRRMQMSVCWRTRVRGR